MSRRRPRGLTASPAQYRIINYNPSKTGEPASAPKTDTQTNQTHKRRERTNKREGVSNAFVFTLPNTNNTLPSQNSQPNPQSASLAPKPHQHPSLPTKPTESRHPFTKTKPEPPSLHQNKTRTPIPSPKQNPPTPPSNNLPLKTQKRTRTCLLTETNSSTPQQKPPSSSPPPSPASPPTDSPSVPYPAVPYPTAAVPAPDPVPAAASAPIPPSPPPVPPRAPLGQPLLRRRLPMPRLVAPRAR